MTTSQDSPRVQHYCRQHARELATALVTALSYGIERHIEFDRVGSDLVPDTGCAYVTLSMEGEPKQCAEPAKIRILFCPDGIEQSAAFLKERVLITKE